jgi:protease-4
MFDMSEFLDNKIGITFDEVSTGDFGELYTVTRPLKEEEKRIIQKDLNSFYETFVTKASEGRGMELEEVIKLAGGRVWTGAQAKEHGLIDVLGGNNESIDIAIDKPRVGEDYKVKYYPVQKPFIEELLSQVEENVKVSTMKSELGDH